MLMRVARDIKLIFRRPPRQQYAALCYRTNTSCELEVMLLTSRETGRWVIPKGWPMAGKLSHEVAAQEAFEEAGMIGSIATEPLGTFSYLKKLKNGVCVDCLVRVYALEVSAQATTFKECGKRRIEWVPFAEAANRVQEPGLRSLIETFPIRMAARLAS